MTVKKARVWYFGGMILAVCGQKSVVLTVFISHNITICHATSYWAGWSWGGCWLFRDCL